MSPRSIGLSDALSAYVQAHSSPPDAVQRSLIERTESLGDVAGMQIAPEQGELMALLTHLIDPGFAVEVGTFTGYSALAVARALRSDARLLCCDVSEEWTSIAAEHWERAGVRAQIDLRIAPAIETLRSLPADTVVDLAFVDADKTGYVDYYEALVPMLSPRGLIAIDNTLWSGAVLDDADTTRDTEAIRAFNAHVAADERTRQVVVPIGDGLTLVRRA